MSDDSPILVTGATGFIGSALVERLAGGPRDVIALAHAREPSARLRDRATWFRGDVRDTERMTAIMRREAVGSIVHLAALSIVPYGVGSPLEVWENNARGTWCILEAARQAGVGTVIHGSSDKVYGEQSGVVPEDARRMALGPYEAAKLAAEHAVASYAEAYGLRIVRIRPSNIYGPGDTHPTRLVPFCVRLAVQGRTVRLPSDRSDGSPSRDWLYIDDCVAGYVRALECAPQVAGEAFNLRGAHAKVVDVVRFVLELAGRSCDDFQFPAACASREIRNQHLDGRKAEELLDWRPEVPLREGLLRTIAWWRLKLGITEASRARLLAQ